MRRVMMINGRRTSVRMEQGFWEALDDVARRRGLGLHDLVSEIDQARGNAPLTQALRVLAVSYFRELLNESPDCVSLEREKAQCHAISVR